MLEKFKDAEGKGKLDARIVKFLMNLLPNKPEYQETPFAQEMFRHPNYISLSQNEKGLYSGAGKLWQRNSVLRLKI